MADLGLHSVRNFRYGKPQASSFTNKSNHTDPRLVDPISAIQQRAAEDLTLVDWSTSTNLTYATVIAKRATVCIPVVSSFAGESFDRNLSLLHNGDDLIQTVADNCDNTIPIIQSVGPVDMEVSLRALFLLGPKRTLRLTSNIY